MRCGASILEIKERGDWKSESVFDYLQFPIEQRLGAGIRVSTLLAIGYIYSGLGGLGLSRVPARVNLIQLINCVRYNGPEEYNNIFI